MKYYLIAGEASGDLHGSNLIKELKKLDTTSIFRCWGGDEMQKAGADLIIHYRHLAFMGFVEVIRNLSQIIYNLKFCKEDILHYKPDVLVLIDYPGFNLRIAKWAKQNGFKVIYYISPQVWAWKENRVKGMKTFIDKLFTILPFEKEYFFKKWNWNVDYVGHPLVEVVENYKSNHSIEPLADKPIVALLPGSRKQEIIKKLPLMLEVSKSFPNYQFIVAKAPGLYDNFYDNLLKGYDNIKTISNQTYNLLLQAKAALVTSGTATLETALLNVPQVVCYKASHITYFIAKKIVTVKYISLVNLILDKLVVKELIQQEFTVENLKTELSNLLSNKQVVETIKNDYSELKQLLSEGGKASEKTATAIYQFLH